MDSFAIRNFGCRVNQAEAFDWAEELQRRGLRLEADPARCGIVVVNSCTLTGRADRDVRKFVRGILRANPGARLVVTGCLAERDPAGFERLPGVWKVVPNAAKASIPDLLSPSAKSAAGTEPDAGVRPFRARAMLKVQDGCDRACRFCIIPSVRGRSVSLPLGAAVDRARELASRGFKEIVLTGIHLCSWGYDLEPRRTLADLLAAVDALTGDFRVRLSSLDPRLLPAPLLDLLVSSPRICPHFHLSLQHASAGMLRAMGRNSTPGEYRDILVRLHGKVPDAALGADVIVGFPGETEEDFRELEAFLAAAPLAYFHVFAYSPRPGTAAEDEAAVPSRIKAGRARRLRGLSREKWAAYRAAFVGRVLDGVVVRAGRPDAEVLTSNYIDVRVPGGGAARGRAVRVRITRVMDGAALGAPGAHTAPPCGAAVVAPGVHAAPPCGAALGEIVGDGPGGQP
jgi:threonylcarbamoyladenosine tRNA methylthiotransferase MtaB